MDKEMLKDKISQGMMLIASEQYSVAKEVFINILKEEPHSAEAYIHYGNTCANLKEYQEAIGAFKKAVLIDDSLVEVYFSIGNVYLLMNDKVKAIEYYNRAEEKGYVSSQMYQIMASVFMEAGDEPQALRNISRAIDIEPLRGDLRLIKVKVYLAFNRTELALETLNDMEKVLPDAFEVYELKTQIYLNLRQNENALNIINKGCDRFPQDVNLLCLKLKVLVRLGKIEDAHKWIEHIKSNEMYNNVLKPVAIDEATLLFKEKKTDEACKVLIEANSKLNDDPDILYILADYYAKIEKCDKLLIFSEKLKKEEYGLFYYSAALFFHAIANEKLGNIEEAIKEFHYITTRMRKETISDPSFYAGYIYRMLSYVRIKEYDKALELATYVENLYPNKADGHAFKYYIYKEMGDCELAECEKQMARDINPNFEM